MNSKILIAYFSRPGNNYIGGSIVNLPIGNTEITAKELQNRKSILGGLFSPIDAIK